MLIDGDNISNDVKWRHYPWHEFFNVCSLFALVSASFWLAEIWQLSRRGATRESEVDFKFQRRSCKPSSVSCPAARALRRACSQAKASKNANSLTRVLFLSHFRIYDSKQIQRSFRYWMRFSIDWLPQFDSLVNFSDNRVKSVCFSWGTKELNFHINAPQHKNETKLWFYGILDKRRGWFTDHLKTYGWRDEPRKSPCIDLRGLDRSISAGSKLKLKFYRIVEFTC